MSEKKNIVIKVKYPTAGKSDENKKSVTGTTSEWNYGRIAVFIGCLLILVSAWFFISPKEAVQQPHAGDVDVSQAEAPKPEAKVIANPVATPGIKPAKDNLVVRSLLTSDINKNEPVDTLKLPLKMAKSEKMGVYYFLEITGMKGKTVIHEWLLNGQVVSQKKVNIASDPWRTASKQMISYTMANDWLVRLVDDKGNKIDEKSFNLELK